MKGRHHFLFLLIDDLSRRFFSTFVKKKSLIFIVRATLFVPAKMLEGLGSVIRHFLNLRPAVYTVCMYERTYLGIPKEPLCFEINL